MRCTFVMSSVLVAQQLIDEFRFYDDVRGVASYEDGQILLHVDCLSHEQVIWQVRVIVAFFDDGSVELPSSAFAPRAPLLPADRN